MLVSISKCYKTGEFPNPSKLPFIPFEPTYRLNLTIKCQTQASTTIPIPHPILQNNLMSSSHTAIHPSNPLTSLKSKKRMDVSNTPYPSKPAFVLCIGNTSHKPLHTPPHLPALLSHHLPYSTNNPLIPSPHPHPLSFQIPTNHLS